MFILLHKSDIPVNVRLLKFTTVSSNSVSMMYVLACIVKKLYFSKNTIPHRSPKHEVVSHEERKNMTDLKNVPENEAIYVFL